MPEPWVTALHAKLDEMSGGPVRPILSAEGHGYLLAIREIRDWAMSRRSELGVVGELIYLQAASNEARARESGGPRCLNPARRRRPSP